MAPTSNEEIQRQHQQAVLMVEGDGEKTKPLSCAPQNELGEISLQDKTQPTYPYAFYDTEKMNEETPETESTSESESDSDSSSFTEKIPLLPQPALLNPICWSTRGFVDVSKLQDMVREGFDQDYRKADELPELSPTNFWDPRNADKDNVTLTRPSHDAWGIGKIVLQFSDDFLTRVYQFPWYKDFEEALQPIIDILFAQHGADQKGLVVRALLASLPPGSTIPVHHDSGEWVKSTHRVHIPILVQDPSKVVFRCGPSTYLMQRISCDPGHVFEINNQAKHAVSNCDSVHRVHLILDYVVQDLNDPCRPNLEPIVLEPGEKLVQTRRSVDRLKTMVPRPTPSYIILGAQKAGTTSLYTYINEHPWVIKARRRETHCLDWRWNDRLRTPQKQLEYCEKFFFTDTMRTRPSCMTGDSTPSYLLDSRRVIPRLKRVFPWSHKNYPDKYHRMKFFVMMRDPVKRAASHYAMVTSTDGSAAQIKTRGTEWRKMTFWEVVQSELKKMNECGLIPYWDIENGTVDQAVFDTFAGSPQETLAWNKYLGKHVPLSTGSYGLLTRGMYALQLRPWFKSFAKDQFLCIQLEAMMRGGVSETMKEVWAHLDLPNHPIEDESARNSRQYEATKDEVEIYIQRFFEPHNKLLASVLQKEGEPIPEEWTNPWPYK